MKYSVGHVEIEFETYSDAEGRPCCAGDFTTGAVCEFHRLKHMGQQDFCAYTGTDLHRREGLGPIIPDPECPLWARHVLVGRESTTNNKQQTEFALKGAVSTQEL